MAFSSYFSRHLRAFLLGAAVCCLWGASSAQAQKQETGLLDRIEHPDRTLKYDASDKQFSATSTVAGKQAAVRPFLFSRSAALRGGDGVFTTHAFRGKDAYRTEAYATRAAAAGKQGFAQTDKTFGTKTVAVKEDRAANQAAPIQAYTPGDKLFLGRGKRQDTIDDLRKQKNLTVDQVREILNKNK